jgi:exopolysaccharide biosynthesis polyprenyl glycosylphosphotransferase
MTSTTSLPLNSKLDLRAPLLTQLSKRIGGHWRRLITLFLLDASALYSAWQVTAIYSSSLDVAWYEQYNSFSQETIIAFQLSLIAAKGLYQAGDKRRDYFSLIKTLTFSHLLLLLITFFSQNGNFVSRQTFILSWCLSLSFTCITRFAIDIAIGYLRQQGAVRYPMYLICCPEDRVKAVHLLEKENRYNLQGWADVNSLATDNNNWDDTLEHFYRLGVTEVFICSWGQIKNRMLLYWKLRNAGITLHILPIHLETIEQNLELNMVGRIPTLKLAASLITSSDFLIKRCFDFCFAIGFILLASPIYLFIALLLKLDSPGAIFYKQNRIGLHGQPFKVWKFRTMVANAEQLQKKVEVSNDWKDGVLFQIEDDPRITRVGKFLRRYSLDELPQLFNVVRGEMSLVGPRPVPNRDVENFSDHHFIRYEVLPGMTGLWQVTRSNIADFEIDNVVRLDVQYMESWSLGLDLQILLKTILVVLGKKGAY